MAWSATTPPSRSAALVRIAYKLAQDRITVFTWDAAEFMRDLKGLIENPLKLLSGRPREAHPVVYVLAALLVLHYATGGGA